MVGMSMEADGLSNSDLKCEISNTDLKRKIEVKSRDMCRLGHHREKLRENPRLTYFFMELTNWCNLACAHCGSRCSQNDGIFTGTKLLLRTLETVAEDFVPGSVMICLTGGEPMLHPDFYKIVEKVVDWDFHGT